MDALLLSRIQFAANISFHILFPTITIALAWLLLYFKIRYNRSGDSFWQDAYLFWVKIFALSFALGVVSGITMSFQFGTNWPGFMETVGNIAGPLLAYEVLTAFFLEATFLGIMLFGANRVSNAVHTLATVLVAVGTSMSAFWILVLNSWMQTPAGFEMIDGVAHATDWMAIIFNPSMPYRLIHMMIASGLTAAFLMAGVSAWQWHIGHKTPAVMAALKTGVTTAALLIPVQILVGDFHGLNTLEHQPAKIAAMEGVWKTTEGAPLVLFALPDAATQTNRYAIEIPKLASLILTHSTEGTIEGIDAFPNAHPPVAPVFWAFRIMVGTGVLMLLVAWWGWWKLRNSGSLKSVSDSPPVLSPWLIVSLVIMTFSGWIATLSGWYVSEIGRQPFLVTGVLRTVDAVSSVSAGAVRGSLIMYLGLYAFLLAAYIATVFYLAKRGAKAPAPAVSAPVIPAALRG